MAESWQRNIAPEQTTNGYSSSVDFLDIAGLSNFGLARLAERIRGTGGRAPAQEGINPISIWQAIVELESRIGPLPANYWMQGQSSSGLPSPSSWDFNPPTRSGGPIQDVPTRESAYQEPPPPDQFITDPTTGETVRVSYQLKQDPWVVPGSEVPYEGGYNPDSPRINREEKEEIRRQDERNRQTYVSSGSDQGQTLEEASGIQNTRSLGGVYPAPKPVAQRLVQPSPAVPLTAPVAPFGNSQPAAKMVPVTTDEVRRQTGGTGNTGYFRGPETGQEDEGRLRELWQQWSVAVDPTMPRPYNRYDPEFSRWISGQPMANTQQTLEDANIAGQNWAIQATPEEIQQRAWAESWAPAILMQINRIRYQYGMSQVPYPTTGQGPRDQLGFTPEGLATIGAVFRDIQNNLAGTPSPIYETPTGYSSVPVMPTPAPDAPVEQEEPSLLKRLGLLRRDEKPVMPQSNAYSAQPSPAVPLTAPAAPFGPPNNGPQSPIPGNMGQMAGFTMPQVASPVYGTSSSPGMGVPNNQADIQALIDEEERGRRTANSGFGGAVSAAPTRKRR